MLNRQITIVVGGGCRTLFFYQVESLIQVRCDF